MSDIFSMGLVFLTLLGYDLNQEQVDNIREGNWESI